MKSVIIDGSFGEGGGQILRTSLALSLLTGTALQVHNIRARRSKPGLRQQHLTAVRAAATIGGAELVGASIDSRTLSFRPNGIYPGDHRFAVGSAGSATLVLQTVLPALLQANKPSRLILEGGTHNPWAPPFDFLQKSFAPMVKRMGGGLELNLQRPGFYPAGGGRFRADVQPAPGGLQPMELMERGALGRKKGTAVMSGLSDRIGHRELKQVRDLLGWGPSELSVHQVEQPRGPGNVLVLEAEFDNITCVVSSFGGKRISAEEVGRSGAKEMQRYLKSEAAVDEHLADQLVLLMAIAGKGSFMTTEPSGHLRTQLELIPRFLNVSIQAEQSTDTTWTIAVTSL